MAFQSTTAALCLLLCCFLNIVCLAQQNSGNDPPSTTPKVQGPKKDKMEEEREGVEKEVLGPLRIWHIVFLVGLVISIGLTVFCCCVDWRIPRTRQEIDETYRRRQLNQKYLHQLERNPDQVLRNNASSNSLGEENNNNADRPRNVRRQPHRDHDGQQKQQLRPPHQGQQRQQRRDHHHQQERSNTSGAGSSAARGVAVTETSARLARIAKSQMHGVQTPFNLSALSGALQKQKQGQRQQQRQT